MLYFFGLAISLVTFVVAENSHKVFRITPQTIAQLTLLRNLENQDGNYSYWRHASYESREADLMVSPTKQAEFLQLMTSNNFMYNIYIDDVEALLSSTTINTDEMLDEDLDWKSYHSLERIYKWMDNLAQRHPQFIKKIVAGYTFEGREIKGLRLSYTKERNPGIFIEGGINPQNWISPAIVTYLLNQLVNCKNPFVLRLIQHYDWYFVPIVNPDGYAFTYVNPTKITHRLWRKTRSFNSMGAQNAACIGTNLNRNWAYGWITSNSNGNPCSENYAGWRPLSEIEAKSLSKYIGSIKDKLFTYISVNGYGQNIMFPFGCTNQELHADKHRNKIAKRAAIAAGKKYETKYQYGRMSKLHGLTNGHPLDWFQGYYELPLIYGYQTRDKENYGFLLPADQITANGEEVMDSLIALFKKAAKLNYPAGSQKCMYMNCYSAH